MLYYPFVESPRNFDDMKESKIVIAINEAQKGNLRPLKDMYHKDCSFGREYLLQGGYKLGGWYFNLSPFCKRNDHNE